MVYWKSFFSNLKEIKKHCGKILRVWAKNQLRFEIFEEILKFTYKNLNGKLIFYPLSLPSSRTFVILCTSGTPKFWGWFGGGVVPPGLGGEFFNYFRVGGCINPWKIGITDRFSIEVPSENPIFSRKLIH